ncbi:chemosensory pili system protein ChpA (sensor histidine kinase/response regulator) [Nitrosomonas sp. PY1]|uniref:hybrid sensor histidine kinase/response regulator n=1 Tax=Nitrosomonas sp. PY1 TaxID=1803906 RepID=UPI001FC7E7AD|nr:response regulator [Nitrosomonas sp. PY1]GKS68324.1 chemosensory pili system protein ChpA (sensor histidine kinase/response regulator) [Nitrosomonas sp. PY1]
MSAQHKLNISSIYGIKEGIYQVFSLIDQNLDSYTQHPEKISLIRDCRNYILQLNGLLEMLELSSITVLSKQMVQLIDAQIDKKITANPKIPEALQLASRTLQHYLSELIEGKSENPLQLFPAYRSLMQAYGSEYIPESDLFFPRLTIEPPLVKISMQTDALEAKSIIKQAGSEYQTGLLKWLRDPTQQEGLQLMATAVLQFEKLPGTLEQRAFWWVTAGFLEDLMQLKSTEIDLAIRRLCGKIEQTMRHLTTEALVDTQSLLRELLYHVAHSEESSQRIADIKRCYVWPGQDTKTSPLTLEQSEALSPILSKLHSRLMEANDIWREYCAGHQESLISLRENVKQLKQLSQQTQCTPLEKLVEGISQTVGYLHDKQADIDEELAMEMATALLLAESIIDDFNQLSTDLPQQVEALTARLQQVTISSGTSSTDLEHLSFSIIDNRKQEKELLAQIAQEIQVNLGSIENILDTFFFEPEKRSELTKLPMLFKQISGAFTVLELERASNLLELCRNLVTKFLNSEHKIIEAEQILLVDGLSSLSFFIASLNNGRPDSYQILEEAISLFEIASLPEDASLLALEAAVGAEATKQPDSADSEVLEKTTKPEPDRELLDIFLEEADELLASITHDLENCQKNPNDGVALVALRRAFHTLKGSGRMVMLDEMSEVAWHLEQVLNRWIIEKRYASNPLLDLISRTIDAYSLWCKNLSTYGATDIEAEDLLRSASELLNTTKDHPLVAVEADTSKPDKVVTTVITNDDIPVTAIPTPIRESTLADSTPQFAQVDKPLHHQNNDDQINYELLPVFIEETQDIIPQIGSKLRAWRILPQDQDIHHALMRLLHTIKGSSHMIGAIHLGTRIHTLESHVAAAFQQHHIAETALDQLENEFDVISGEIEQLQTAQVNAVAPDQDLPDTDIPSIHSTVDGSDDSSLLQSKSIVRINADLIDRLVNESGEVNALRSKIETQLNAFKLSLQDLSESTHRLHDQLREIEIQAETRMQAHNAQQRDLEQGFDPLELDRFTRFQELTRLMAESVDDITTAQKSLRTTHHIAEEATAQQAVIHKQLQQSLMQIRTIPFGNYAERYYRIARQVAEEMGKKVHLEIHGTEVEIDRNVLEKLNPPLEHLLRNAIAHGIEGSAQRTKIGKPEVGAVSIRLHQQSNEVTLSLSDDGQGLNLPRIREEARRLRLIEESSVLDDDTAMSLIFAPGLSTTEAVTGIAGRGIGLDIVKNEISILGGRISVNSSPGKGTTFILNLPLMLSVAQVMMVRVGKQHYAIPAFIVASFCEMDLDALKQAYQKHYVLFNDKQYPFSHLAHLLGEPDHTPETDKKSQVLFLHSGTQHLAIHVDELLDNTEVVIKNLGAQLTQAPGIEGATITGNGEMILIMNPVKLMPRSDVQKILNTPTKLSFDRNQRKKTKTPPTIMVVDDSLTVRKVTCRLLEREGCDVLIAKNGAEAIRILQDTIPDVMLVDLEMPKMNGFELIRNIRTHSKTAEIPIIIISSRTAEKHQKLAKELGVNVFLGKPYKEDTLIKHLAKFISKPDSI